VSIPSALHVNQQPDKNQHHGALHNLVQLHPARLDWNFEVIAMARAAIHLQVIATVFHAVEIEPDLSGCIGSTELLPRSSVSLQKTNHGTSSGFSIGKTGTQLKITIEILECAFNLMGPDRCPGSEGEKNRG
jgi:hypothetical protein